MNAKRGRIPANTKVQITLAPEEYAALRAAAEQDRRTLAGWCRLRLLDALDAGRVARQQTLKEQKR